MPQVARSLQTFAVIPPGAFPNGYGLGAPHTAVVSAASLASAEAQTAKIVAEVEAERQKAKEKEAFEILQKCREEGGCGAEGQTGGGGEGPEEDGGADPSEGPNPWGCRVWVSWEHSVTNYLGAVGHWECAIAPPDFELQVSLFLVVGGRKQLVDQSKPKPWNYPGEIGPVRSGMSEGWDCSEGSYYQIRVWGRTWDAVTKKTNFVGKAYDGHTEQCSSEISPDLPPEDQ